MWEGIARVLEPPDALDEANEGGEDGAERADGGVVAAVGNNALARPEHCPVHQVPAKQELAVDKQNHERTGLVGQPEFHEANWPESWSHHSA